MKKFTAFLGALALLFSGVANATIINSLPYNLTNGSLADATQVMANYNQIVNNTNTNAAHNGANSDITSLTGLTTPLASTYGGTVIYTGGTTAGTANAQTLATVAPSNFALTAGNMVTAIAGASNTTAMTFSVNGQTAKNVKVQTNAGLADPGANAVLSGNSYLFYYDGTEFILTNPSIIAAANIPSTLAIPSGVTATTQSAGDTSTKLATDAFASNVVHVYRQTFTSNGTYTPHAGILYADAECVGSGGSGGGGNSGGGTPGSGGGGGEYGRVVLTAAAIGVSQTITIGAAATGGTTTNNGADGNTSSIGTLLSVAGGKKGLSSTSAIAGGLGGTSAGAGDIKVPGQPGGGTLGAQAFGTPGGNGGGSYFGAGAIGTTGANTAGANGLGYGAGGAGGTGSASGGNSSAGMCTIVEYANQ